VIDAGGDARRAGENRRCAAFSVRALHRGAVLGGYVLQQAEPVEVQRAEKHRERGERRRRRAERSVRRREVRFPEYAFVQIDGHESPERERGRERLQRRVRPHRAQPERARAQRARLQGDVHTQGHERAETQRHGARVVREQNRRVEDV